MPLKALVEGEGRLLGFLGANATLGGVQAAATAKLQTFMPLLENLLTVTQIAVAIATLIYMIFKIRKIMHQKLE
jgi:hypothetical protein